MVLQNLTLVREFFLDCIKMSSVVLGSLMNLSSSSTSLSLELWGLQGQFPENIFHLPKLKLLSLSRVASWKLCFQWISSSFAWESSTTGQGRSRIFSNHLTGELGGHWSKSLHEIRLECNKIYGLIPPSISELVNLTNIDVSSNNLSGIVDLNLFSNMINLWGPDLSHSSLSVATDKFLKIQNQLNFLSLSYNRIHGEIPQLLSAKGMQSSQYLDLFHNFLTIFVDLTSNLPQQPFPILPQSMCILLIANNKLTGEIPPWICNISTFQIINLSNNNLSGNIPQCLGNFSTELSVLNLRSNSFHGTIPGSFTEGNKIRSLDLNGNELEG
uniref:Leucine-rich repeat-containing N-terminal plant-type domain-containing protein n=1 Tax=Salix viminalis TaxID=40686 RepID=A0A6N2NFP0_SALVM